MQARLSTHKHIENRIAYRSVRACIPAARCITRIFKASAFRRCFQMEYGKRIPQRLDVELRMSK